MSEPRLDPYSDTWAVVKARAEARLEAVRKNLERVELDHPHTMFARGQIEELKGILALAEPRRKRAEIAGTGAGYHEV